MPINGVKTSPANQDRLAEIEKILLTKHSDLEMVRTYHDRAVAMDQVSRARKTFEALQSQFPNDQQIRSLNIALCLKQQDYPAAMREIETLMSVGTPEDDLIDAALAVRAKLGPMTTAKSQRINTAISLCMIVKDEIANIGACLKNAKALATRSLWSTPDPKTAPLMWPPHLAPEHLHMSGTTTLPRRATTLWIRRKGIGS
jgi:hypothetical protein